MIYDYTVLGKFKDLIFTFQLFSWNFNLFKPFVDMYVLYLFICIYL